MKTALSIRLSELAELAKTAAARADAEAREVGIVPAALSPISRLRAPEGSGTGRRSRRTVAGKAGGA